MTVAKSIKRKPEKPRPDWPLTASSNGQWVKKIKGRVYAFGRWDEPENALARYVAEGNFIRVHGCRPIEDGSIRLDVGVKQFLDRQKDRRDGVVGKKISPRHFEDLKDVCGVVLKTFSRSRKIGTLRSSDFTNVYKTISVKKDGKKASPSTVRRNIANVKTFFNWLAKNDLIPNRINFGSDFVAPVRQTAADSLEDDKEFSPAETWAMIKATTANTRAMIWLALNTGSNNACCANITIKALDLEEGVMTWKRHKARNKEHAKVRVIELWPETVDALKAAMFDRPEPKDAANENLFFLTRYGAKWDQWALSRQIGKLKTELGINRDGVGFNSFRNVIETHGGTDQVAINWVMGHIDPTIAVRYRNGVPSERIRTVTDNVRRWLREFK